MQNFTAGNVEIKFWIELPCVYTNSVKLKIHYKYFNKYSIAQICSFQSDFSVFDFTETYIHTNRDKLFCCQQHTQWNA